MPYIFKKSMKLFLSAYIQYFATMPVENFTDVTACLNAVAFSILSSLGTSFWIITKFPCIFLNMEN